MTGKFIFWMFVVSAVLASASLGVMAYKGEPTSWSTVLWPLMAVAWASVAETYRKLR